MNDVDIRKDLLELLEITQSINTLYNKIEQVQSNKSLKQQYINYLEVAREVENNIYNRLNTTPVEAYQMVRVLKGFENSSEKTSNIRNFLLDPIYSRMDGRIINQINYHFNKQNSTQQRTLHYQNKLNTIFLLSMVKEMRKTNDTELRQQFFSAICNLSFVDRQIELILINANFDVEMLLISEKCDFAYYPNFRNQRERVYTSKKSKMVLKPYIDKMVYNDNQETDFNHYLKKLYIETHLSLMNDKMIHEIDSHLYKLIRSNPNEVNINLAKEFIGYVKQYKRIPS